MKKNLKSKSSLKKAFNEGTLSPDLLGSLIEHVIQYRGFYIDTRKRHQWAGPWRNDLAAANADAMVYAQQGFETGISQRQN